MNVKEERELTEDLKEKLTAWKIGNKFRGIRMQNPILVALMLGKRCIIKAYYKEDIKEGKKKGRKFVIMVTTANTIAEKISNASCNFWEVDTNIFSVSLENSLYHRVFN